MSRTSITLRVAKYRILVALAILVAVAALLAQHPSPVSAYDDRLAIECNDNPVVEGDTFRLHMVKNYNLTHASISQRRETMKVYWTTEKDTAKPSDYRPLEREGQASNGFQSWNGRMGRTFYTTEDDLTEQTESFRVRAENADENGTGGECTIEISDDDGPGPYTTYMSWSGGSDGFDRGDVIQFVVRFTESVSFTGESPTLGFHLGPGTGEANRFATLYTGVWSTWTFRYEVQPGDFDPDGLSVPSAELTGGRIRTQSGNHTANKLVHRWVGGAHHRVFGQTSVARVSMASTPERGDTYRTGEHIQVEVEFDRRVRVDGDVALQLNVGDGDDSLVQAPYHSGSGTRKLVFQYQVAAGNNDASGVSIAPGTRSDAEDRSGIVGTGKIVEMAGGNAVDVNIAYSAISDRSGHKVDGRAYVKHVAVTSEPANGEHYVSGERIMFSLTFDRVVSVQPKPAFTFVLGDQEEMARFYDGSLSDTLVFSYRVDEDDVDQDGVSVPKQEGFLESGNIWSANPRESVYERIPMLRHQADHRVNGVLPTVVSSEIISDPDSGDTYQNGETIEIALGFDGDVDVLGRPQIRLLIDGNGDPERSAVYSRGSGSDTLIFAYTVQVTDVDDDGVALMERDSGGFEPSTTRVYQADTENALTGHIIGIDDAAGHRVDGRPSVTSTTITSSPAQGSVYRPGETINISLSYDDSVVVEGTPSIAVEIGQHLSEATYRSGSGTNTIVFGYEVQGHDQDNDGLSVPALLADSFHDGSIYTAGREIELDAIYPGLDRQEAHQIAGKTLVESVWLGSNPGVDDTYERGDTIQVLVRFDHDVTVTGTPRISLQLGSSIVAASFQGVQDGADYSPMATGRVLAFAYAVQAGDEDNDGISVVANSLIRNGGSILDAEGDEPLLSHETVTFERHLVGIVPPEFSSARTSPDGQQVIITFSEPVNIRPDLRTLGSFTGVDTSVYLRTLIDVFTDGRRAHTRNASISGTDLTLTLDSAIRAGMAVTVAYDDVFARDVPGLIVDQDDGLPLEHFTSQTVANNSTLASTGSELWPVISGHSLSIAEGGAGSYTVALGAQPEQDVTVSLSISPSGFLTASASELTFTPDNWSTPQSVTLTSETDGDDVNLWREIVHTATADGFIAGHLKVLIKSR